ncbi:unnamed protein product, partial [Iphiclides podalirius]
MKLSLVFELLLIFVLLAFAASKSIGRKPSPVCMPLPGGISKFCGRVYNIARSGEEFRACLGLELQSKSTVEAAVRVSCFKFGPRGVTSESADPLPLVPQNENPDEDDEDYEDDDDDDDDFGLSGDEYEEAEDDDDDGGELDAVNDVESADYTGFSLLGEDLLGDLFGSGGKKSNKIKKKQAPTLPPSTTTRRPRPSRRPTRRPASRVTTLRPFVTRTTTVKSIWEQALHQTPLLKSPLTVVVPVQVPQDEENDILENEVVEDEVVEEETPVPILESNPTEVNDEVVTPVITQSPLTTIATVAQGPVEEDDVNDTPVEEIEGQVIRFPCTCVKRQCGCCTGSMLERMGANGLAMVKPEESGGLPIPNPQGGVDAVIDAGEDDIEEYDDNLVRSLFEILEN